VEFADPFAAPGIWLKGNLHAHTTVSDGDLAPQDRVAAYERHGYDFLALTDHRCVTEVDGLRTDGMVLLRGTEAHAPMPTGGTLGHALAVGLPRGFALPQTECFQELLDALSHAGAVVFLAHPYWSGQTSADLAALTGYAGIEAFNTNCLRTVGRGTSSVHWDELLCRKRRALGIAVDDVHRETRDTYQGWIVAKAAEPSPEAIIAAIRSGLFYASSGPTLEHMGVADGVVKVRTSPVATISFVCNGPHGAHVYHEDGSPVTEAEFRPPAEALYVRVEATDLAGRTAWSNPIFNF
jgi:hypothetical protein